MLTSDSDWHVPVGHVKAEVEETGDHNSDDTEADVLLGRLNASLMETARKAFYGVWKCACNENST